MSDIITHNQDKDGIDRRGFLKCMAWAGTGVLWTMTGGVLKSQTLSQVPDAAALRPGRISVSSRSATATSASTRQPTRMSTATLREAVAKINALPRPPVIHAAHRRPDPSRRSRRNSTRCDQMLKSCKARQVFYVPGEHDILNDNGKQYRERFGKGTKGTGWYSFDQKGVHFIGLVNVMDHQGRRPGRSRARATGMAGR